jgi:hypothetical protein
MSYEIDRSEPSPLFLEARNVAGVTLQEQFKKRAGSVDAQHDFRWVKTELTWPSFDHLTFAYGNRVFSVLVDALEAGRSSITRQAMDRFLEATTENQLEPCVFPVKTETMSPVSSGWSLFHPTDQTALDPETFDVSGQKVMSKWELRNFAIQIVRDSITRDGRSQVLSFTDVLGVDPQIWFQDDAGKRAWVIVRYCPLIDGNEWKEYVGLEKSNPRLAPYDGYFGAVSLASSAAVLRDLDGRIVPLSERFSGKAPLYRGDGFHVKFDGLQRIHVS